MINCEIEVDLARSKDCVISGILNNNEVPAEPAVDSPIAHLPVGYTTGIDRLLNSTKLYVPVVTL